MATLRRLVVVALLCALSPFTWAVQPHERLADPALESRAREISAELRCLVCQNQSIDDSEAPLARDLRVLVRERLKAGDSNGAVLDFVVARYGEYVLLRPPFGWHTLLLWLGPFLLLLAGGLGVWRLKRRAAVSGLGSALTGEEQRELERLLRDPRP